MAKEQTTFTITDPRYFEGTPYEVAERSCYQAAAIASHLQKAAVDAEIMARNAFMERNLSKGEPAGAEDWDSTPEAKRHQSLQKGSEQVVKAYSTLALAAGFNPKAALPDA